MTGIAASSPIARLAVALCVALIAIALGADRAATATGSGMLYAIRPSPTGQRYELIALDPGARSIVALGDVPFLSSAVVDGAIDAAGRRYFVRTTNGNGWALYTFDTRTGALISRVAQPSRAPLALQYDPGTGRLHGLRPDADGSGAHLIALDPMNGNLTGLGSVKLALGRIRSMIDPIGHRYVAFRGGSSWDVLDTLTGDALPQATVALPRQLELLDQIRLDAASGLVYGVAVGPGNRAARLIAVDARRGTFSTKPPFSQNVASVVGGALDPAGRRYFAVTDGSGADNDWAIDTVDTRTGAALGHWAPGGPQPINLQLDPDGSAAIPAAGAATPTPTATRTPGPSGGLATRTPSPTRTFVPTRTRTVTPTRTPVNTTTPTPTSSPIADGPRRLTWGPTRIDTQVAHGTVIIRTVTIRPGRSLDGPTLQAFARNGTIELLTRLPPRLVAGTAYPISMKIIATSPTFAPLMGTVVLRDRLGIVGPALLVRGLPVLRVVENARG